MEINIINVSFSKIKELNLKIKSNQVTGIYQDENKIIYNLLLNKLNYEGNILINNKDIKSLDKKTICGIDFLSEEVFLTKKVSDEFYLIKNKLDNTDNFIDKIISSLKMVGLQELYLERDISSLSKSEKRLLQIALNLIINPDIIIFSEPFIYLDKMGTFNIYKIISDLIKKYKKTILILSNDINILYKICNNIIIFKDDKILINDKIDNVFKNTEKLKDNEIQLPNIIMFSSIAKDYGINIRNSKIVKDLIKDVYRNAKTVKKDK